MHLPSAFAGQLFSASPLGMTVVVARGGTSPVELAHPLPISPVNPGSGDVQHAPGLSGSEDFRWSPEGAPSGPVALIVSRADERIVAPRNGVEIGRARIVVADPAAPFGTHAFVAQQVGADGARWLGMAVPGHAQDAGHALAPDQRTRVRLPTGFLQALRPILHPGATLVVTDAPILPHTTGAPMTVVTNQPPEV